jgi:hypothetical protein
MDKNAYQRKLAEEQKRFLKTNAKALQNLELANATEIKLNELRASVESVTGKECRVDFAFYTGSLIGMLRTVSGDYKNRMKLCQLLGITYSELTQFQEAVGYLPYYNQNSGRFIEGKLPNFSNVKPLLKYLALKLGLLYSDEDFADIGNEEQVKALYERTRAKELDKENGKKFTGNIPELPTA